MPELEPAIQQLKDKAGCRVAECQWITEDGFEVTNFDRRHEEAYLSAECYGDHHEIWIVALKDGQEVLRYKARDMTAIIWLEGRE